MTDNPSNSSSDDRNSANEQSPSEENAFRKFNPNWEEEIFGNVGSSGYKSEWDKKQEEWNYEGPRPFTKIFRDFLTMSDERDCAYLLNEPTANFNHAYGWYAGVTIVGIIIMVIVLAITIPLIPEDSFESNTPTYQSRPTSATSPNNTQAEVDPLGLLVTFCVAGPIGIGINIIIYSFVLFVVHTCATGVFGGVGEYEKLVYGAFTLFTAVYAVQFLLLPILLPIIFLSAGSEGSLDGLNCLVLIIGLPLMLYVYRLYTLVVKTVYQIGWGQAFMSAIGIPFGSFFVLYCTCIFCLASGSGGQ